MSLSKMDEFLHPMTETFATELWEQAGGLTDWPFPTRTREAFLQLINDYQSLRLLHLGNALSIGSSGPIGFVMLNQISQTWLPEGVTAVECGTYILPQERGKGWNLLAKEASLQKIFADFQADWAFFIVDRDNLRAQKAITKLPWALELETDATSVLFSRYLRRKAWESGRPCLLYKLSRQQFQQAQEQRSGARC